VLAVDHRVDAVWDDDADGDNEFTFAVEFAVKNVEAA
jgi:hypothetical protein